MSEECNDLEINENLQFDMSEDIHFNDPKWNPRNFNSIEKKIQKGLTPEEQQRIINAALRSIKVPGNKGDNEDLVLLLSEAQRRIKLVRQYAGIIDQQVRAAGKDHDRRLLYQEIMTKYLDNFGHSNKDELLFILASFLTELTIKEIF